MPKLYVLSGDDLGRTYEFTEDRVVLGRGQEADLVIRGRSVSRKHARLERTAGGWHLTDLDSSNGMRVGGLKVAESDLADGETFHLGEIELRFRDEEASPAPAPMSFEEQSAETRFVPGAAEEEDDQAAAFDLEGDWDEEAAAEIAPTRSAPRAPAPPTPEERPRPRPPGADRAREAATRRAEALGGGRSATGERAAGGGRVLQYNKVEDRGGLMGAELGQQPSAVRWLLYLLAVVVFLGLAYGAYTLTAGSRRNAAVMEEE